MSTTENADRLRLESFLRSCTKDELYIAFSEPWLNEIIPGIADLIGCGQGTQVHFEGDAAVHTALVFENLQKTSRLRLVREPNFIELLSVLLHDLRKPATRNAQPNGAVSFPGHETLAAEDVPKVAKRLGLSAVETSQLHFIVACHGEANGFPRLSPASQAELKASPWIVSLALIQEADARSCILSDGAHALVHWDKLVGSGATPS